MHVAFIPYGVKHEVDWFLHDLEAQKFKWKFTKGKEVKYIWIQGSVRYLPGGVIEYVFPREWADMVLTSLDFHLPQRYRHRASLYLPLAAMRMALGLKKAPKKFKTDVHYLWRRDNVNFITLGIREDVDQVEPDGEMKGYVRESL